MKRSFSFILAALFVLLLAWGVGHNRPAAQAPSSLIAQGYGGPIEMSLSLSPRGAITGLKVLKHNETSSFIGEIDTFLKQFIGRTRKDHFVVGQDIDAISGATITSTAITQAVQKRMNASAAPAEAPFPLRRIVISFGLFLIAIIAFMLRHSALRWAVLAGGFAYFGIIAHTMLSIIEVVQAGLRHITSFISNPLWWLLLAFTFISALFLGRIYCGSLCPFAIIQEILFYLKPHKPPIAEHATPGIDQKIRLTKYALLFAITGLCLITGNAAAANIEPFVTLFAGHGSKLALSLLMLMLIMSVFNFRFWCKYLCPVGALTSLAAVFSLNKIYPTEKCTACGACSKICPTQAISTDQHGMPSVDPAECISCAKCLRGCPRKALTFGYRSHEKK